MLGGYNLLALLLAHLLSAPLHDSLSLNKTCNPTDVEALLAFSNGLDRKGIRLVG
jgi:hypothetical protein